MCALKAGIPNLSQNIRVISIIGRYLEHSRIVQFYHGGEQRMYLGSADWMQRNIERRLEVLTPIEDVQCKKQLQQILKCYFSDSFKARLIDPLQQNLYVQQIPASKQCSQMAIYQYLKKQHGCKQ